MQQTIHQEQTTNINSNSPGSSPISSTSTNSINTSSSMSNKRSDRMNKSKRVRTIFTPEQLKRLEHEFNNQMYLVGHDRIFLAKSLKLSEAQVKVWFQNRRIKHRKMHPWPIISTEASQYHHQPDDMKMDF